MEEAKRGDYDSAIRSYDAAIEANPKVPEFYLNRGAAYFGKRDFERAIEDASQALALKQDYVGAFTDRGNAYLWRGDPDRAILDFDQAIKLQPDFYPAFVNRAKAYFAKKDYQQVVADYERALQLKPEPPRYLFTVDSNQGVKWDSDIASALLVHCLMRAVTNQALQAALGYCDESLRLRPGDAQTLGSRALVHFRLGEFDNAVKDATLANALEPDEPQTLFLRGVAKLRLGDTAGGERDLDLARRIDPDMDRLYTSMGIEP